MPNDNPELASLLINAMPGKHLVLLPDSPAFTIVAVSDEYLAAFGLPREALVNSTLFEVFFPNRAQEVVALQLRHSLTQVIQTKQPHLMADQPHQWPNSQTGILEWRTWRPSSKPVLNHWGELICILHTIEDVTQAAQLDQATQANRYLQTLIDLMKEPMQVLQPVVENGHLVDFRFKLTNQAYAAYAKTTPQQLQGKRVSEVFPGYLDTVSFTNPVATYTTGQPLTFEIHYDQDGLDLYNMMSTFKLEDEVVVYFTDFTGLKQLQLQLEGKIEDLKRSNENLQQFAYIASHDLQEPLRKIQSFSDLLKTQYADQLGGGIDLLERMQSSASRMSRLIKDLLAYSRISTQQDTTMPVVLQEVLQEVLADLDLSLAETGAQVELEPLPTVLGDPSQLRQLFQNLLSNALKFRRSASRPTIRVSCRRIASTNLPDSARPTGAARAYYQIAVADNGIGFDEKYVNRIFQLFQRLHGKEQYAGTGIGLAICEKVVVNHGGAITATSQPGQGATFTIYLPA
ncbi:PAS domain-containing sensor histidine kinase [Spirosoma koreense]